MSQITLFEGLLLNLRQQIRPGRREYLTQEQAYEQLKNHTGKDFGYDADAWSKWIEEHPNSIRIKKQAK